MSKLETKLEALGIKAEAKYVGSAPEGWGDRGASAWKVKLVRRGRQLTVGFFTGSAITNDPDAASVISCLISDARAGEQSFEEFCSDFGYDEDSRKAEKTWNACRIIAPRIERFLGDDFAAVEIAAQDY